MRHTTLLPLLSLLAAATPASLLAQEGAATEALPAPADSVGLPSTSVARQPEVQQLERFVVAEVPLERSINPLTREIGSVLGDDRNILNTPRAVSTLTTALFNERQIHGVREIVAYAPGAYAPSSYGKATVPSLRGDTAETYLNGQRLSYNLYGYFPSFNGVEALDIVRGPGSAVYGSGYFSGGYVNYVSKAPSFKGPATTVTTRLGTWAPSETSYLNASVQIDSSAPLSDKLAWRLSYEGKGGDTFFRRHKVGDDRQDLYGALTWRLSADTTIDFNAQLMWQSSPEILGVNRVNQDLIDKGLYYTGESVDRADWYMPGVIPATQAVVLPWDATLFSVGDYSNANIARFQALLTHRVNSALRLVNRSLFEYVDRRRHHAFSYTEFVEQLTAENRTEAWYSFNLFGRPQKTVAGATIRYEGRESYTNYFNEYFYNFDITNPSKVFDYVAQYPNSYWPGQVGPRGMEFFSSVYDSPETVRSETWNPALFLQQDLTLTDQLSAVVGLRRDTFWARARDPLPPAEGPFFRDDVTVSSTSTAFSLIYKPTTTTSLYVTHNRIRAANGNVTGGGVILNVPNGLINRDDFRNLSELFEVGAKASFLDNKLFAGVTAFEQWRSRVSIKGKKNNIVLRGFELETTYQPTTGLSLTANATFQDGHYLQSRPFQMGGRSIYPSYQQGRGPGGLGTGTDDSFDPWGNQVPVGDWPLLGMSKTMLNGSVRYQFKGGFGLGWNAQWQSRQVGNLDNEWHLNAQVTHNANLFLERGRWLYNLDLLNVTNERNWIHNGDAYTASMLVFRELPFRLEGYVKYRF